MFRLAFRRVNSTFMSVRNASTGAVDPIQKAFVLKLQEYMQKSKNVQFGMVDATAEDIKEMKDALSRIDKAYGAIGKDMTKFPTFTFEESELAEFVSNYKIDFPENSPPPLHKAVKDVLRL